MLRLPAHSADLTRRIKALRREILRAKRGGFTIMELMVAIAILIVIILSVAVIFNGASKSVSSSTGLMETLSNVRAVQQQVDKLVSGIDKRSFLVIRSQLLFTNAANTPAPNAATSPRFDQIGFVSYGNFPNRTGAATNTPFVDATVANAAHVWIGQLVMERQDPPNPSYNSSATITATTPKGEVKSDVPPPLNQFPTGFWMDNNGPAMEETDFTLGIHTTLMIPALPVDPPTNTTISVNGQQVKAYPSVHYDPASSPMKGHPGDSKNYHLTSSRVAVAYQSPSQLMSLVDAQGSGMNWDILCFRFKALWSPYDTDETNLPFVNGYFRTHPVALRGVSSFKVEWQDSLGQWHSYTNPAPGDYVNTNIGGVVADGGDNYQAAFAPQVGRAWPIALRFTYHIVDPNNRLPGGRDFTQVVRLPE